MKEKVSYAVITGASSGIGQAFAARLAKEGYSLILIARNEAKLKEVKAEISKLLHKNAICITYKLDVTDEAACFEFYKYIQDQKIGIFINNAGFGDCSYFPDGNLSKEMDMIDLNIKAMHRLTKHFVRLFLKQRYGYLLNVASLAGLMPAGPYMATYYATKAYVTSFTLSIARELRDKRRRIYIGCLCPGPVDTNFNKVANVSFSLPGISAKECVDYAVAEMKKKHELIIPQRHLRALALLSRFIPRKLCAFIVGMQQKRKF